MARRSGPGWRTHGKSNTRMYKIWQRMRQRCFNKHEPDYHRYGGRGISVCTRWDDYEKFYEDMIDGYRDDLTIERDNVDGDYEPGNCRWATIIEQSNNRRTSKWLVDPIDNERLTMANLARKYRFKYEQIKDRVKLGFEGYRLIEPVGIYRYSQAEKKDIKNMLFTHTVFEVFILSGIPMYWLELVLDSEVWCEI